ncbi:MAG: hypothetical protein JSV91_00240 [Phycisphaerales bacterium]|nr:MAG: hypothetical protein JSV91_00240 [Phycisphaerales bacterium]
MTDSYEQQLISRVVEGGGTDGEWAEVVALAERDPRRWRELAETQRDHAVLARLVEREVSLADYVDAPVELMGEASGGRSRAAVDGPLVETEPLARIGRFSGWAVAALIALVWVISVGLPDRVRPVGDLQTAGIIPVANATEAWNAYLQKGRESGSVVRELPERVLLDSRTLPGGDGFELLYLRQVVERTTVPYLDYVREQEGAGQPTLVRYQPGNPYRRDR